MGLPFPSFAVNIASVWYGIGLYLRVEKSKK